MKPQILEQRAEQNPFASPKDDEELFIELAKRPFCDRHPYIESALKHSIMVAATLPIAAYAVVSNNPYYQEKIKNVLESFSRVLF